MTTLDLVTVRSTPSTAHLVTGEQVIPGLFITPLVNMDGQFSGGWTLIHEGSGLTLVGVGACLSCVRKAAEHMTGFCWTRSSVALRYDDRVRTAVADVTSLLWNCATDTCDPGGC